MNGLLQSFQNRIISWREERQNLARIARLARQVSNHTPASTPGEPSLVLFNVSTRLTGLSLNAAFQLITGWSLRLGGASLVQFVCRSGLKPCVLGTNRQDYTAAPPCPACIAQSGRLYAGAQLYYWQYQPDPELEQALQGLSVDQLSVFEALHPFSSRSPERMPLGRLVLPSIRWALRRHTLPDDESTRYLMRQYILSADSVARQFASLLDQAKPRATVIFNGMMYPEAAARWAARQLGVRNVAHEVGFQRFSTFFTEGEPTAYPMHIPEDFELSPEQNKRLDAYLEQRFQGNFSMAGIQFWPEMRRLDRAFLEKIAQFRQLVPVFTNVIYDTSQVHANVIFPHMFAWLDAIAVVIRRHPETLFVIRAHPDELRPGTKKQSNETVREWVNTNGLRDLPNVVFIDSQEYISSYELIQKAKFVVVYNSSIGLEAALMSTPVLVGGKARYTQYPTAFFPQSQDAFKKQFELFLAADEIQVPPEFGRNARRFLYFQLYRASLPLDAFLQTGQRPGFVKLRDFSWEQLLPAHSQALKVIHDGILRGQPYLMKE